MALHRTRQAPSLQIAMQSPAGRWMRNGFVESFNGRMRPLGDAKHRLPAMDEPLNETMFRDMAHARAAIRAWTADCNEERPHSALGYQTPKAFAEELLIATDSRAAPPENSAHLSVAPPTAVGVSTQRAPVPAG